MIIFSLLITLAILLFIFLDWYCFYREGTLKISYKKLRALIAIHPESINWQTTVFNTNIRYSIDRNFGFDRFNIKLSFIDFWRFRFWDIKLGFQSQRREKERQRKNAEQVLTFVEDMDVLLDPERIRKELDDNGFQELNYIGNFKSIAEIYTDAKSNDVISICNNTDPKNIPAITYYVCTRRDKYGNHTWMRIEEYNLQKKKKEQEINAS